MFCFVFSLNISFCFLSQLSPVTVGGCTSGRFCFRSWYYFVWSIASSTIGGPIWSIDGPTTFPLFI